MHAVALYCINSHLRICLGIKILIIQRAVTCPFISYIIYTHHNYTETEQSLLMQECDLIYENHFNVTEVVALLSMIILLS